MAPIETVKNVTLPEQIFGQLTAQILTEELKPGENLPSERALAELFGVNRHVVREAVKRLQQAGLVQIVHGGGTRVLDVRQHAGLEILELVATYLDPGQPLIDHWLSVLELRVTLGRDIARKCALRATPEFRSRLPELVEKMRAASDDKTLYDLDVEFWAAINDGSGNLAYRLAYNTLTRLAGALGDYTIAWVAEEVRLADYQTELADAIAAGEADRAESAARATLQNSHDRLLKLSGRAAEQQIRA